VPIVSAHFRSLFQFIHTTKLDVGDERERDNHDTKSKNVPPQMPVRVVCDALLCEILRPSRANKQIYNCQ